MSFQVLAPAGSTTTPLVLAVPPVVLPVASVALIRRSDSEVSESEFCERRGFI